MMEYDTSEIIERDYRLLEAPGGRDGFLPKATPCWKTDRKADWSRLACEHVQLSRKCFQEFFNRYQTTYSHVSIRTCIRMLPGCFRDDLPMDCLFRHLPSEPKKHLPLLNL